MLLSMNMTKLRKVPCLPFCLGENICFSSWFSFLLELMLAGDSHNYFRSSMNEKFLSSLRQEGTNFPGFAAIPPFFPLTLLL